MESLTIGSTAYSVYANESSAELYLDAAIHVDEWREAVLVTQQRALVTATRLLDRQIWLDAYNTQALRFAEEPIKQACIELAAALVAGSEVQSQQTTAERIKRIKAGSVEVENFRGIDANPTRFPQIVQELLQPYLGGVTTGIAPVAAGVDGETIFPLDLGFTDGV